MRGVVIAGVAAFAVTACSQQKTETAAAEGEGAPATAAVPATAPKSDAPAGEYALDKTHASVVFRVSHLGLSNYTARFTGLDGKLTFDPAAPERMSVRATIDPKSIETDFPLPEPDFDGELAGPNWLDAGKHPAITFVSTRVEPTGPATARVTGDLTMRGVTKPVVLEATFNGGYAGMDMDPAGSRIGFSAKGALKRSDFGVSYGIPAPGTTMGVSDNVDVLIEAEFTRPRTAAPA